jgi:hypothetical protein
VPVALLVSLLAAQQDALSHSHAAVAAKGAAACLLRPAAAGLRLLLLRLLLLPVLLCGWLHDCCCQCY